MGEDYVENTELETPEMGSSPLGPVESKTVFPADSVEASPEGEEYNPEASVQAPVEYTPLLQVEGGNLGDVVSVDYTVHLTAIQESLTAIQTHLDRPLMTTPFEEYSMGEGLILLLLVFLILQSIIKIVKVGFSWLLW